MSSSTAAPAQITLYTNHGCGWCQRVHIVLKELGLHYDEVLIDLNGPRPDWYLKLNPRGLVPTLHYKTHEIDEMMVESGPIVEFLTELYPSHLTPRDGSPAVNAVHHWRQRFFVDTFFTKVTPLFFKISGLSDRDAQLAEVDKVVAIVTKEMEPSLADAAPFFGGSPTITYVEAMAMPFVMLMVDMSDDVIWPADLVSRLRALPHFAKWMDAGLKHESVTEKPDREHRKRVVLKKLGDIRKKYAS